MASEIQGGAEYSFFMTFVHRRAWSQHLKKIVPPHCKIICPNALPIEVSIQQNAIMPAWFDIYDLTIDAPQDETGIMRAAGQITRIVEAEMETSGMKPERIMLGGFSQGGSVALYSALTSSNLRGLAGVLVLSSWLPLAQQLISDTSRIRAESGLPILQCHGAADPLLPYPVGTLTNTILHDLHFTAAELQIIPGLGHECNEEEFKLAQNFICKILKP